MGDVEILDALLHQDIGCSRSEMRVLTGDLTSTNGKALTVVNDRSRREYSHSMDTSAGIARPSTASIPANARIIDA